MTFETALLTLLVSLLGGFLGGLGGRWIAMRIIHRRIDTLAEDVDGALAILRKRAGRAGVEKREAEKGKEQDEMDLLREAAEREKAGRLLVRRKSARVTDADAEAAFAGDGSPRSIPVDG